MDNSLSSKRTINDNFITRVLRTIRGMINTLILVSLVASLGYAFVLYTENEEMRSRARTLEVQLAMAIAARDQLATALAVEKEKGCLSKLADSISSGASYISEKGGEAIDYVKGK